MDQAKIHTKAEMLSLIKAATANGHRHYVYGLSRGDSMRLFYIGKGVRKRVFQHEAAAVRGGSQSRNPHKTAIIRKHGVGGYVLFSTHPDAKSAFNAERDLIAAYGIENLANVGPGGEGEFLAIANMGRNHSQEERVKRTASVKQAWADEDLRQRHSTTLAEISATPEMREKRSKASLARWSKLSPEERSAKALEQNSRPEVKAKIAAASAKAMQDPEYKARAVANLLAHNAAIKGTGKPRTKYATKEEARAAQRAALDRYNNDPANKAQKAELAKQVLSNPENRAALSAGRTAQAAKIRALRSAYCALKGITSPGKNFCNIDKADFDQWASQQGQQ